MQNSKTQLCSLSSFGVVSFAVVVGKVQQEMQLLENSSSIEAGALRTVARNTMSCGACRVPGHDPGPSDSNLQQLVPAKFR